MTNVSGLCSLLTLVLLSFALTAQAERQVRFSLGDNVPVNQVIGNVAVQAGLEVPSSGFDRVLIDRLPFLASKHFSIDNKGVLKVIDALDRDKLCAQLICCFRPTCTLNFRVFITNTRSSEQVQVDVTLRDENDNGPRFSVQAMSLLENTPVGTKKPLPKATDIDSPDNNVKSYQLIDNTGTFSLIMTGSDPFLRVEKPLDREVKPSYSLRYIAKDGGSPPREGSILLQVDIQDVNDNAPRFEKREITTVVNENVPDGTSVAHLKTVDNDEGENGQVTYRLTADSTPIGLASTLFAVGRTSGRVTVKKPLDFEDNRQASGFVLYIVAADKGKPPRSSTATLRIKLQDVNDNPPEVKLDPASAKVIEGEPPGRLVATVTVKDVDEVSHGKVKCALEGQGKGFRLQELSSLLLDLITLRKFDHEVESSVDVTISCRDSAEPPKSISQTFSIAIVDKNDNAPKFVKGNGTQRITLPEDWPMGTDVIHLEATDADSSGRSIVYSISGPGREYFSVHKDSGRVYLRKNLDREVADHVEFSVIANDSGTPPRTSAVKVIVIVTDINDNAPLLKGPTIFSVPEGAPISTQVAWLQFKDPDFGLNGTWMTQMSPKETIGKKLFRVMEEGRVLTKSPIDREAHESLVLDVIAFDAGRPPRSTAVVLTIKILDQNDNAPMLVTPSPGSIIGNSPPLYATANWNTTVVRLRGQDPDNGNNGTFYFRIVSTNASNLIGLESQTGRMYTKWAQGKGKPGFYYINLELVDRGNPPLRSTATMYLHIGESGPLDRMRGVAINNIVILALIIVCSVALAISLIVAIVWARSRISRSPHGLDGRDPYTDYDLKVPDESTVPISDEDYVDPYHHCSLPRKDLKSAPMQTFSAAQPYRSVVFMPVASTTNGILQRGPEQHRGPISPERIHLRRNSDASNEDSGKGGSDDNLSKCSISNPPGSISSRPVMYVRRPCHEGTMC